MYRVKSASFNNYYEQMIFWNIAIKYVSFYLVSFPELGRPYKGIEEANEE